MRFQKLIPRMGYETTVQGPTPHRALATHGVVRKRPDCPTMWGFNTPPYLGGYPPTPRVRGQTPPRYTPVPIFHRATMTFLSSIALGGDTPPAWVPIPPLFRGGRGGSKPPPRRMGLLWRIPPQKGGYPPLPDGSQNGSQEGGVR